MTSTTATPIRPAEALARSREIPRSPGDGVSAAERNRRRRPAGRTLGAAETARALREMSQGFALSADAGRAYDDLNHALLLARELGRDVPCLGPAAAAWTSDDYYEQRTAADRCLDCPALELCQRYADLAKVTAGTWAGETKDPARKPRGDCGDAYAYISMGGGADKPRSAARKEGSTMNSKSSSCTCGCSQETSAKANYRPGHDARHVSALVAQLENDLQGDNKVTARHIAGLAKSLPSAALQAKFQRAADRLRSGKQAEQ